MRLSFCKWRGFPLLLLLQGSLEGSFITGGWGCSSLIHPGLHINLMSAGEQSLAYYTNSMDFLRGFGDGLLTEIPRCDPFSCFCRAAYSWVLYWQNNMKEACICFTLASLHMPRATNVPPTTPAGQRNLLQSMWALAGQFSLKNDSHRRRSGCSTLAIDAEAVLVGPCLHWHFSFTFHGVSPYFCWPERENLNQQSLIILSWITFLYLGCYYYNSIQTWRQSKKLFDMLAPRREENQYKWTKTTQIEHYM